MKNKTNMKCSIYVKLAFEWSNPKSGLLSFADKLSKSKSGHCPPPPNKRGKKKFRNGKNKVKLQENWPKILYNVCPP